jgi:ubiquinone/menaquinone biosynthesis C-methylase UbiE
MQGYARGEHDYHLQELAIANDVGDPRRIMPHLEESDRRILDVGCGAGQTLISSAPLPEVLAVGVDSDHPALRLGTQLTNAICFVAAKGEALPFGNESFDLVISRVALPYMKVGNALNEMCRVLRVGGRVWLVLHPFDRTFKDLISNLVRFKMKATIYQLWVLTSGVTLHLFGKQWAWILKPGSYESFQTSGAVRRLLKTAGFERIEITRGKHFVVTAVKRPSKT